MIKVVVELTDEDKTIVIKHLDGMCGLYMSVNGSGTGPLRIMIEKLKTSNTGIVFDYGEADRLLLHLRGASKYDRAVWESDPLYPIIMKIEHDISVAMNPRAARGDAAL